MVHLKPGVNHLAALEVLSNERSHHSPTLCQCHPRRKLVSQKYSQRPFFSLSPTAFGIDILLLRFPGPHLSDPESRARMRANAKPDVNGHRGDLVPVAAHTRIRTLHASHLPNRGAAHGRPASTPRARGIVIYTAREP